MNVVLGKAGLANSNSTDQWKRGTAAFKKGENEISWGAVALACRAAPHNGQVNPAYKFVKGRGEPIDE